MVVSILDNFLFETPSPYLLISLAVLLYLWLMAASTACLGKPTQFCSEIL